MSSIPELQIKKFRIDSMSPDSVVVFVGKRGSGKSWLVREVLYRLKEKFPIGIVISPTERYNKFFRPHVPSILIHDRVTPDLLSSFMKRQGKMMDRLNNGEDINPNAFLVLDDCLFDRKWHNSEQIREILMNGRHINVMLMITCQYAVGLPPATRQNADYVVIYSSNTPVDRKRLFDQYGSNVKSFAEWNAIMDQCTDGNHCIIIDNKTKSNKLEDTIFWYKAQDPGNFKTCDEGIWIKSAIDDKRQRELNMKKDDTEDEPGPGLIKSQKILVKKVY